MVFLELQKHENITMGDRYHKKILMEIYKNGSWDENPRPHYEDDYETSAWKQKSNNVIAYTMVDGTEKELQLQENQKIEETENGFRIITPAYTKFLNHIMTTYDISKGESPLLTLRPIEWKSAIKEIFWIYQMQSNRLDDLHTLGVKYWDKWDIGDGTIGCRSGETVRKHHLMDKLLDGLVKDPFGRRHIINLWQEDDFSDLTGGTTKGLNPCCYETIWNCRRGADHKIYLDMLMNQRSSDFAALVSINELQYVALLLMVAKHCGYEPGKFTHITENVQIYDRHMDNAIKLVRRTPIECCPQLILDTDATNFYDIKFEDFHLVDYPLSEIKEKNPQLNFDLAI